MIPRDVDDTVIERIRVVEEVRKKMPEIIAAAKKIQKTYFDKNKQHIELAIGDEVLVEYKNNHTKDFNKFIPAFRGPFTIKTKNNVTYGVEIFKHDQPIQPIQFARIKLFHRRM